MAVAGKYEMTSSEKFEDYYKAIGVSLALRKIAAMQNPTMIFTEDGDNYTMKTVTTFKTIDLAFTSGKEFIEETADGRKCNTVVTRTGNQLVHVQTLNDLSSKVTRTFTPEGMSVIFEAGDVVAKRTYKRVE